MEFTPRRSTRIGVKAFQVKPVREYKTGYNYYWPDAPLEASAVVNQHRIDTKGGLLTIDFYSSIFREEVLPESDDTRETFRVGDVALINTRHNTYPSIGVIIAMWQTRALDEKVLKGKAGKPQIQIHWFVQPRELAQVRAQREYAANEIFFSIASTAIISPADILARCTVSNKPSTGLRPEQLDANSFFCLYALNSMDGVFYSFDWSTHRAHALEGSTIDQQRWCIEPQETSIEETPRKDANFPANSTPRRLPPRKRKLRLNDTNEGEVTEEEAASSPSVTPLNQRKVKKSLTDNKVTTPSPKKRKRNPPRIHSSDDELSQSPFSSPASSPSPSPSPAPSEDELSETPTKKRILRTPSKPKAATTNQEGRGARSRVAPTPHSKAAIRARLSTKQKRLRNTKLLAPEGSFADPADLGHLPADARLRAMHVLHVASRPDTLPCREDEYMDILSKVLVLLEEGAGGCVYISGVPGTGKTATVHAVVRELKKMAERNETNPFTYVEVNGLKIPEPAAAYGVLWESLCRRDVATEGHLRITSKEALRKLDRYFSEGGSTGPGSHACIVLMDELDQLVTTKQDVVYNFFNWPSMKNSKLIVLAVANTMDLPERAMSGKVRSRLGMERVDFRPYNRAQLETILNSRLNAATEGLEAQARDIMDGDAVKFVAMKVSGISGDARRVLDICRRAVEVAHSQQAKGPVKTNDISNVIKEMQNSPTAAYLRQCSFHERVMLAATWKCIKREGVSVVQWTDIAYLHGNLVAALAQDLDSARRPSETELILVLDSLIAARALLIEDPRKGLSDGERKVMLNLEELEIVRVLIERGGDRWRTLFGI